MRPALATLFLICAFLKQAYAVPDRINYQGRLHTSGGSPVTFTTATVTFRLYPVPSLGSAFWTETYPALALQGGLFNVELGSLVSLTPPAFSSDSVYLGVQLSGDTEMTPRQRLVTAPYAMKAGDLDAPGNTVTMAHYVSFTAGTNLSTSVAAPLDLSGSLAVPIVQGSNGGTGQGISGITFAPGSYGVQGAHNDLFGNGAGVYGLTSSSGGTGVFGQGGINGVRGMTSLSNGRGVIGENNSSAGNPVGVWGQSTAGATNAVGVVGTVTAPVTLPSQGVGVFGFSDRNAGAGVRGENSLGTGFGVYGLNTGGSNTPVAMRGEAPNAIATNRIGVLGTTDSAPPLPAGSTGVYGYTLSFASGSGVRGSVAGATNSGYGVYGENSAGSNTGAGVYGSNASSSGYGVQAQNAGGAALFASGATGALMSGVAVGLSVTATGGRAIYASTNMGSQESMLVQNGVGPAARMVGVPAAAQRTLDVLADSGSLGSAARFEQGGAGAFVMEVVHDNDGNGIQVSSSGAGIGVDVGGVETGVQAAGSITAVYGKGTVNSAVGVLAENTSATPASGAALKVNGPMKASFASATDPGSGSSFASFNAPNGQIVFQAGKASISNYTVTNNFVTPNSVIFVTFKTSTLGGGAMVRVAPAGGTFTVTFSTATTFNANDAMNFFILNQQ